METLGPFKGIYMHIYVYTGLYMVYIGIVEKKMETVGPFIGICRVI